MNKSLMVLGLLGMCAAVAGEADPIGKWLDALGNVNVEITK